MKSNLSMLIAHGSQKMINVVDHEAYKCERNNLIRFFQFCSTCRRKTICWFTSGYKTTEKFFRKNNKNWVKTPYHLEICGYFAKLLLKIHVDGCKSGAQ